MTSVGRRLARFSLVGWIGAILQLLLISLLTKYLGVLGFVATLVAVEITILHNFVWHERFTWSDRGTQGYRRRGLRLCRFHAGNGLISLGGNTVVVYCLVERFKVPTLPAAMAGIAVCSLANFLVAERWVYTKLSACNASKPTNSCPEA